MSELKLDFDGEPVFSLDDWHFRIFGAQRDDDLPILEKIVTRFNQHKSLQSQLTASKGRERILREGLIQITKHRGVTADAVMRQIALNTIERADEVKE